MNFTFKKRNVNNKRIACVNEYNIVTEYSKDKKEYKTLKSELDKDVKKLNKMINKQDKLLYIAFNILLNLAEDFKIERKMVKRKIVSLSIRMLERNNVDLLLSILFSLKKMSIFAENKDQMVTLSARIFLNISL